MDITAMADTAAHSVSFNETIGDLWRASGIYSIFSDFFGAGWQILVMIVIACILLYLAIGKGFEPLLLVPIATGMLLANIGGGQIFNSLCFAGGHVEWSFFNGKGAYVLGLDKIMDVVRGSIVVYPSGEIVLGQTLIGQLDGTTLTALSNVAADVAGYIQNGQLIFGETVIGNIDTMSMIIQPDMLSMLNSAIPGAFTGAELVKAGLFDYLYLGVKLGIYPCLIFMGVGAMTDFSPLIANPKSLLLGAAAQLGIFVALLLATLVGFGANVAASIGIIGGADGPTAILVASMLAPEYLAPIAVAAYSYMALIPVIQPPIMRLLTTKKERSIVMGQLRPVSKRELIIFPIAVAAIVILILPDTAPLIGSLMFGNLLRVCGVTERLSKTVQNELCNIVTIFLGTTVGATAVYSSFLAFETVKIILLGLIAFAFGTAGGVLLGKLMCKLTHGQINPLIGSAGVSAVPMAARVSQTEGQKANPKNFLLMHAMGPNVAGVIGSAVAAGVLLSIFG